MIDLARLRALRVPHTDHSDFMGAYGPVLVVNPSTDRLFEKHAQLLIDDGVTTPEQLESGLRLEYPGAVVHARMLSGEPTSIWYAYRDGRWVNGDVGRAVMSDAHDDLKATSESIRYDANRLKSVEEEKTELPPSDPRVDELSDRAVDVAERISVKANAQRQIADEIDQE